MKKSYVLAFIAALLFAVAGVLNFISGSVFRGAIGCIAALSFILAGIHWRRTGRNKKV